MVNKTRISPKWAKFAEGWLGTADGRHCHWCKYIHCEDGGAECENIKSPFCDGDRIRTWDGIVCATNCPVFELDDWYKSDNNFDSITKAQEA